MKHEKVKAEPYDPVAEDRRAPRDDYAHHFIASIHDLRGSVERLDASVRALTQTIEAAEETNKQLVEVMGFLSQNINIARGVGHVVQSIFSPRRPNRGRGG